MLFECNRYREEQVRWRGVIKMKDGRHEYNVIIKDTSWKVLK